MGMARTSRPFVVAGVLTALLFVASACGGINRKTEVLRLRSANPLTSDLYVRIRGPGGAVSYLEEGLARGAFGSTETQGFFVPPGLRRKEACSFSHTIDSLDAPQLQDWRGKKMKVTVYGNSTYATTYCRGIQAVIFQSHS